MPLGGDYDALAIIARACRSRLFGYFFAVPASRAPAHDELRALAPRGASAALLFGGSALDRARWEIVATSLPFARDAWPLPAFASRGAFGDAWTQVRYDPDTLQIVERRGIAPAAAAALPDARFADAYEVEALLRRRIAGEPAPHVRSVLEVRSPIDLERLRGVEHGGRIQFSTPLHVPDLDRLASFIEVHPQIALRVHGFRHGFDAALLSRFTALREVLLDVHRVRHAQRLGDLHALHTLHVGEMQIDLQFLDALTNLHELHLRGTRARLDAVQRLAALESLELESTAPLDVRSLACAQTLRTLELAHGEYELRALDALTNVRKLRLRALDAAELPPLHALLRLERLELDGLTRITDLRPIAQAPSLRELRIAGMPQLNVGDFEPLQGCAGLLRAEIEIGSRRKVREVYRLLKAGERPAGEGRSGRRIPGT